MRCLFLCFLCSVTALGQVGSFNVLLKNDSILTTRYAYLDNGKLGPGFMRIDSDDGRILNIDAIHHIDGRDATGKARYFMPVPSDFGLIWGERTFQSERITLYYTKAGQAASKARYKPRYFQYTKDDGPLRILSLPDLSQDLGDSWQSRDQLAKGHKIGKLQAWLWAVGGATMVGSLIYETSTRKNEQVPFTLFIGAGMFATPWFLQGARRRHYIEALKVYRGNE